MRKRFTRALYAVSAAAAITASLSLGASAANAAPAGNKGTVACGGSCIDVFSARLGSNVTNNAYVPGDTGAGGRVGTEVNLHIAGNYRPNGDFIPTVIAPVSTFCGIYFSPVSYACLHYPTYPVFEVQFTPNGYGDSNLCAGAREPVYQGENVTLQPCGASANTLWIADQAHCTGALCRPVVGTVSDVQTVGKSITSLSACGFPVPRALLPVDPGAQNVGYCPWINGADANFSNPLVLTVDTGTYFPMNQLKLERLQLLSGSVVRTSQLFAFYFGTAPF